MSEDSGDDTELAQRQALPVDENYNFDGPPATAEEYLAFVRKQAKECPDIMVAGPSQVNAFNQQQQQKAKQTQTISYLSQFGSDIVTPPQLVPPPAWVDAVIANFRKTREIVFQAQQEFQTLQPQQQQHQHALPLASKTVAWKELVFRSPTQPRLSDLKTLDHVGVSSILELIAECITDSDNDNDTSNANSSKEEVYVIDKQVCVWVYGLLCCVDDVIDQDTQAALRSLMRACTRTRAALTSPSDPLAADTSLVIAVISVHFHQGQ
eukprot:c6119_g1_i1.p1 GENE.c6119_g1_i1~~c6119_g1_i1.p1  ORF type:complete len:274 (+),score=75.98 c6119_g1_i1:27-824(+)